MNIDEAIAIVECLQAMEDSEQEALDTVLTALIDAQAKVAKYEEMDSQLHRIAFEEWHGHYQDGAFWIFDSDGEGIASGATPIDAFDALKEDK